MPRVVRLEYVRAPGAEKCPEESYFRNHVEAHVSYPPFSDKEAARLRVVVGRDGWLFRGQWEVADGQGGVWRREFPPAPHKGLPDCFNMVEGLAFTYAVDVDPLGRAKQAAAAATAVDKAAEEAKAAEEKTAAEKAAVEGAAPAKEDPLASLLDRLRRTPPVIYPEVFPPRPPPLSFWKQMDLSIALSSYILMTAGFSADVGPGMGIGANVQGDTFSVALELRGVFPARVIAREVIKEPSKPYEFDVALATALLVPCARWKLGESGAVHLAACGVLEGGGLIVDSKKEVTLHPHLAFGPRLRVEVPFASRFALFGFGEVLFAPLPLAVNFDVGDPDSPGSTPSNTRWGQSIAAAFFGLGLSVSFQ